MRRSCEEERKTEDGERRTERGRRRKKEEEERKERGRKEGGERRREGAEGGGERRREGAEGKDNASVSVSYVLLPPPSSSLSSFLLLLPPSSYLVKLEAEAVAEEGVGKGPPSMGLVGNGRPLPCSGVFRAFGGRLERVYGVFRGVLGV